MKVKVLSRNPDEHLRETKRDIHKVQRNYDKNEHPFEAAREYMAAVRNVKLTRIFAKPFIHNLEGHKDGVSCVAKHPGKLSNLLSGSFDGEVVIWNLPTAKVERKILAHDGIVRGIAFDNSGENFYTVGEDSTIKLWKTNNNDDNDDNDYLSTPINTIITKHPVSGISHHRSKTSYITCNDNIVTLWEDNKNTPTKEMQWGNDKILDVKFNPVQTNIFASCVINRDVVLYDIRNKTPIRGVTLDLRANKLCWNPMEAYTFTTANENYTSYTFDIRKFSSPVNIHMDHVDAVTDIDYSPTGKEFVTASFDRTIRIFETNKGHSREIYHTKRMQIVTCVAWSLDNKYIISGSDEMNLRVWKSNASEKLGALKPREKAALNYSNALIDKFSAHPQVKRIARHRHVPKPIYKAQIEHRTIREKEKRKEANRRRHSKPGKVPFVAERNKHVQKVKE